MSRALFVGRFQPLHSGHVSAIKEALSGYDELVIVVGSAQENITARNPLTAGERVEMVSLALKEAGVFDKCYIVPVPDTPESGLWPARCLSYSPAVDAVFSGNDYVELLFRQQGAKVIRQKLVDGISATLVREKIAAGDKSWEKQVPACVAKFLKSQKLDSRIRALSKSNASIG